MKEDLAELVALGIEPGLLYTPVSEEVAAQEDPLDPEPRWICYDFRDRDFHEHGLEPDDAVRELLAIARAGHRPSSKAVARSEELLTAITIPEPRAGLEELLEGTRPPTVRYFLKLGDSPEHEVSLREYIEAERVAGFHPKPGCGQVATYGFSKTVSGFTIEGRTEHIRPISSVEKISE